jgi:hypothetical protein
MACAARRADYRLIEIVTGKLSCLTQAGFRRWITPVRVRRPLPLSYEPVQSDGAAVGHGTDLTVKFRLGLIPDATVPLRVTLP